MKRGCLSVLAIARASIPVGIASLNASFYAVAALTLQSLVLFASTDALCQSVRSGIGTIDLEQQLDIPLNNGIQGEDRDQADFLLRLGGQAQRRGDFEKAIANWLQALDLYQKIRDDEGLGLTYDFLGVTYAKLGRYQQAEDALRRRLGIARSRQDFQGQIYGLNNIGTVLLQAGNLEAAQETFYRSTHHCP
jgi:tetratricopeptide (TPR) repeat protein